MKKITCLLFLSSLLALSHLQGQTQDEKLDHYLNYLHTQKHFSGEILVAKGKNILFDQAIGLASREHNLPLKTGVKYSIASITKTFTAALIIMAEKESRLKANDKAIDYIPGLSEKFRDITLHQLLRHTSGLVHNEGIPDYWLVKSKLQMTEENMLEEINQSELLFTPGEKMHYSSPGYYLLALVLEKVYEKNYEKILSEKILEPLQMAETGVNDHLKILPGMASGYHLVTDDSLVVAPYRNYSMLKGAGDLYSTSEDLLKWTHSFLSKKTMTEEMIARIFASHEGGSEKKYGYGWYIGEGMPQKYFHGGGTWGFSTQITFFPKEKIQVIVLSNVSALPVGKISDDVAKIALGQPFKMPEVKKQLVFRGEDLKKYSGQYVSDSGKMKLEVICSEQGLFAQLAGNPPFQIYPKEEGGFFGKKVDIDFTFETQGEQITGLKAERMGQSFHFTRQGN